MFIVHEDTVLKFVYSGILVFMYLILYVELIVIMSYFIMYFVNDDKNKGDQSYKWRITNLSGIFFKWPCPESP